MSLRDCFRDLTSIPLIGSIDVFENCGICYKFRYCLDFDRVGRSNNEEKMLPKYVCGLCYFQFKKIHPEPLIQPETIEE